MTAHRGSVSLVTAVGLLAVALSSCSTDGGITPPPPPPPPPSPAEISIVSIVDPETGLELGGGAEGIRVSGRIGVVIEFETSGQEVGSLDLVLEGASGSETVPCDDGAGQGSVGLGAETQSAQCVIDTAEGIGACVGQAQNARFPNGTYAIRAELTLADGTDVSDEGATPLLFDNSDAMDAALDIGPRVVSVGADFPEFGVGAGVPFWGGPRDLTWRVCPVVYDPALTDICRVEISARTLAGTGNLDLGNGPGQRASSEAPFTYTARYRDDQGNPVNEDLVEDDPAGGGHVIGEGSTGYRVFLCDGTNVTSSFGIQSDVRHLDTTAPGCSGGGCAPEIGGMAVLQNGLYSDGDLALGGLRDGGVGGIYGETVLVDAYEFDSGDPDLQELFLAGPAAVEDLPEDDGCGSGATTDPGVQFGCGGTEAGLPVDAYFLQVVQVADLLGNALGDGASDRGIDDEFADSDEFGVDRTPPSVEDLVPPADDPPFVWNPDQTGSGCPAAAPGGPDCETIMWESVDPDLASGDEPSGVEAGSCGTVCDDDDGDGRWISGEILAGPAGANEGDVLSVSNAGLGADLFEAFFCAGGPAGAECDGSDDGAYTVEVRATDQAVRANNLAAERRTFVLDVTPPVIGFGGITGLNASNAATVEFVLDASVVDRNGDGSAVASATVQVTIEKAGTGDGVCGNWAGGANPPGADAGELHEFQDVLVTPPANTTNPAAPVIVDVTGQVNADQGDFSVTFTAQNQSPNMGAGDYLYCFTIKADDGARRKNGADDGVAPSSSAGKDFTWQ
jgi:hypothetical protein